MLLFALCLALSTFAHAELLPVPALKTRVTDLTQTLSQSQQAQLEQKLAAFEAKKGSQIVVLIVPSTQPEDIAQYAIRVVEKWKLGRKKVDDGILVLVAKSDRKIRIEVGYGLEGPIPDLTAKRVISEVIAPKFKRGDFFGGMDAGVDKLISLVDGEPLPLPEREPGSPAFSGKNIESLLPMLLFGALITGLVLRSMFGTFFGSTLNGGLVGGTIWLLGVALGGAAIFGVIAFFITMMMGGRGINGYSGRSGGYGGRYGGGGFGGGSSSGGFDGGGGGFGGGGASGDW